MPISFFFGDKTVIPAHLNDKPCRNRVYRDVLDL